MLFLIVSAAHAEMLPNEFLGKFRGPVTGDIRALEGDFNMTSQAGGSNFQMTWPPNHSVDFEASENPAVFHADLRGRLLEGAPTYWARLGDGNLIVYSMQIDQQGGYDLYSYIYEPAGDGLNFTVRLLRSGSPPLESKGRLKRYDR